MSDSLGIIMLPISVRGVAIEAKDGHLLATFTLSEPPAHSWIKSFQERASGSVLGIAAATFRRHRVFIELPRQDDVEMLIRSVEAIAEGVNLDVQLQRDTGVSHPFHT